MSHTQSLDWGLLMGCILQHDDGRDRLRAQWNACNEVIEHPAAYYPLGFMALPSLLEHMQLSDVIAHAARADEEKSQSGRNVVRAFASWRLHVTEVEALNAGRLHMLASTLRTLADLHAKSSQPEIVLARIADLGSFIETAWAVAVPLSGDIRTWSQRITRRYDLLAADWREL